MDVSARWGTVHSVSLTRRVLSDSTSLKTAGRFFILDSTSSPSSGISIRTWQRADGSAIDAVGAKDVEKEESVSIILRVMNELLERLSWSFP
jgi:hypothetical protein